MKKMIIILLLSTLLAGSFSACQDIPEKTSSQTPQNTVTDSPDSSSAPAEPENPEPSSTPTESENPEPSSTPAEPENPDTAQAPSVTVDTENSLLFHQEGVTMTASPWNRELSALPVHLENTSDRNYIIQLTDTSVNGIMMESSFSQNLDAHAQTAAKIEFSSQALANQGIQEISQIQTKILLLDGTTFETIYTSQLLTITLNSSAPSQPAPPEGEVIYDQDGLKIVSLGLEDDPTWGKAWKIFITNSSDKDLVIAASNAIVNDSTLDVILSAKVLAGASATGVMTLFQNDLDKYQIEEITSLELCLDLQDPSDYQTLQTTEPIILHFSADS